MKLLGCTIISPFTCDAGQNNGSRADAPRVVLSAEDAVTVILYVAFCVLRSCGIQKQEGFVCISITGIEENLCECCRALFCFFLGTQTNVDFRNNSRSPCLVL